MPVLYEDAHLVLDDTALTIHHYYLPFGEKRIPYANIRQVRQVSLGINRLRVWGTGLNPLQWLHLDWGRPGKSTGILLDLGKTIRPVLTPDNPEAVLQLLEERRRGGQLA
jgi:hypothetical protein